MTFEQLDELIARLPNEERCARWRDCHPHVASVLEPMEANATYGALWYCPRCLVAFTPGPIAVNAPDCPPGDEIWR